MASREKRAGDDDLQNNEAMPKRKVPRTDPVIHIIKIKLTSARCDHLKKLAVKNGIKVCNEFE